MYTSFGAAAPALTYAQQCMADRDACYAKAGTDKQGLLDCDSVYSKCFAADPTFAASQAGAKQAGSAAGMSALVTIALTGAVGAGLGYGGARLFKKKPETAKKWATAGAVAAPGLLIYAIVKAIGSFT